MKEKTKAEEIAELLYAGIVRFVRKNRSKQTNAKKSLDISPNRSVNNAKSIKNEAKTNELQ